MIREMIRIIDWVLALPEALEHQLWADVQQFEEEKHMRYVSSFERIATRRGMEKGIEKGMEKGMEKGISRGQAVLLGRQLIRRFGPLPAWVETRLNEAEPAQLETWALRVLEAESLEAVFEGTDSEH